MNGRTLIASLTVENGLLDLINNEILPGSGIDQAAFWAGFSSIVDDLSGQNRALLARRQELEQAINNWHLARRGQDHDPAAYRDFLYEVGYLVEEGPDFAVSTGNVDPEITAIAGPQLVVPVKQADEDRKSTRLNSSH